MCQQVCEATTYTTIHQLSICYQYPRNSVHVLQTYADRALIEQLYASATIKRRDDMNRQTTLHNHSVRSKTMQTPDWRPQWLTVALAKWIHSWANNSYVFLAPVTSASVFHAASVLHAPTHRVHTKFWYWNSRTYQGLSRMRGNTVHTHTEGKASDTQLQNLCPKLAAVLVCDLCSFTHAGMFLRWKHGRRNWQQLPCRV